MLRPAREHNQRQANGQDAVRAARLCASAKADWAGLVPRFAAAGACAALARELPAPPALETRTCPPPTAAD